MKLVAFVEGANPKRGGQGLVGVPTILSGTAAMGHQVSLLITGSLPTASSVVQESYDTNTKSGHPSGRLEVISFSAAETWNFSLSLLWKAPNYVRTADCLSLHSLYSFPVLLGYLLARLYRKPYGVWPHGVLAPFQRGVSARKKRIYDLLLSRQILDNASVLFFSAKGEHEEAKSLNLKAQAAIVPDGIDAATFSRLPQKGLFRKHRLAGHQGELIVFLARLNAKKGVDVLIKSMTKVLRSFPNARLAIVGAPDPPNFLKRVEEWIAESGIASHTTITGPIAHEEKLQLLSDADVLALPSQAENFGFSIFEAMSSRVPVVVSDTLNYSKEIADSGAGLSVSRTPEQFAEAIVRILESPTLKRSMGENGLEMASRYSLENTGSKVALVFQSIIENRPLPAQLTA